MYKVIKDSQANSALNIISAISAASSLESFQLIDVFESVSDAIFIKDGFGRWIATNASGRRLFKLNLESWVGKTDADLARMYPWFKRVHDSSAISDERAWLAKTPIHTTEVISNGENDIFYFDTLRVPIFNNDGTRKVLIVIGKDVTDTTYANDRLLVSGLKIGHLKTLARTGSFEWDVMSGILTFSDECKMILGIPDNGGSPYNYGHLLNSVHPSDRREFDMVIKRAISKVDHYSLEHRVLMDDGSMRHITSCGDVVRDKSGHVINVIGTVLDVTAKKEVDSGLALANRAFEHSNDGIIITNANNEIVKVNRAFSAITGMYPDEVLGKTPSSLPFGQNDGEAYDNIFKIVQKAGYWDGEIINRRSSGEVFSTWTTMSVVYDDYHEVSNYVIVFSDITAHNNSMRRIAHLSNHDPLTDLPNRSLLSDRIEQSIVHAKSARTKFSLFHVDVDNFKSVNDAHGSAVGDYVLQEVAKRLVACSGDKSTVARIGGDEFVIVYNGYKTGDINALATRIIASLSVPIEVNGLSLQMGASIGVASYPKDGETAEEITSRAGMAMYHAKNLGRSNFQYYNHELNSIRLKRLYIENGLKTALSCGELTLFYQPQVNIKTGELIGAEALVRWMHPELGLVPPGSFIDIAEENGMIIKIGEWAMMEVCRQVVEWQKAFSLRFPVAVNISPMQFRDKSFESVIADGLSESKLAPEFLEIEITESVTMHGAAEVIERLRRIKSLGVKISIDDFGTGYSSLSYLRKFSVDKIKIDKSFISDHDVSVNGYAIVAAIINMAKSLNLNVIAEGVETEEQLNMLKNLGCDEMQGFYFAKPLTVSDFTKLLEDAEKVKTAR